MKLISIYLGICEFKCYLESDFISHLHQVHQQCDKYDCYICAEDKGEEHFTLQPKALINVSLLINHCKVDKIFTQLIDLSYYVLSIMYLLFFILRV